MTHHKSKVTPQNFINVDKALPTTKVLTDEAIINIVGEEDGSGEDEEDDEDCEQDQEPAPLPSSSYCLLHLAEIERYLHHYDVDKHTGDSLQVIKSFLLESRTKACIQKKITDMFQK